MPEGTPGQLWYGCYVGDRPHFEHVPGTLPVSPIWAGTETATLIIGPPRSGKTSTLIIPSVLDAPAAVVSTSTKPDVLMATVRYRSGEGYVHLFDPSGALTVPSWVRRLRWSPVVGCEQFDRAVSMAHGLSRAARPGASLSESAHWVERAEALLAPLLFAAALSGRPIGALCQWVLARDLREPQAVVAESGHELAAAILSGVAATDERERSGIFSTAAGLLSAYRSDAVLEAAARPNFDPVAFAASSDTALHLRSRQPAGPAGPSRRGPARGHPGRHRRPADRGRPGALRPRRGGQHRAALLAARTGGRGRWTGAGHAGLPPGPLPGPRALGRGGRGVPHPLRRQGDPARGRRLPDPAAHQRAGRNEGGTENHDRPPRRQVRHASARRPRPAPCSCPGIPSTPSHGAGPASASSSTATRWLRCASCHGLNTPYFASMGGFHEAATWEELCQLHPAG